MQTTFLPVVFDLDSPRWLRKLRWIALISMTLSVLAANYYGIQLPLKPILSILAGLAIWNACLPLISEYFSQTLRTFIFLQIVVDLFSLTAVLWLTGGFLNPFASFYVFHIMHAGLLLNALYTILVSIIASLLLWVLIWAPGLRVGDRELVLGDSPIWFGIPVGLVILIFCLSGFILVFLYRLRSAHKEANQRNKMTAIVRLMGGLAHELGTTLNTILILAKDLEKEAKSDHKKELQIIYQQAKRCGDLVALLLGYSSGGERNFSQVKYEEVELSSWLSDIYPAYPVKIEIDPNLPARVALPELVLRQVLLNILKNAAQALADHPSPQLHLQAHVCEETHCILFKTQDNGPGFSEESKEKAFEAFYTTKEPGQGLGLGLYLSYYLMEQIGGKIEIGTSPLGGAEVLVWVPYGK